MAEKRQEGRVQVPGRQTRGGWRRESAGDLPAKKIGIQTGKKKDRLIKGLERWKKQMICVAAGIFVGAASQYFAGIDPVIKDGYTMQRSPPGQGEEIYSLKVAGLAGQKNEEELEVVLGEEAYTKEEAEALYDRIMEELPQKILGENESFDEIRTDMNLVSELAEYGVSLIWQSQSPEILETTGQVHSRGLSEEGERVLLHLRLTDSRWPREYEIPVTVKPPVLTPAQEAMENLKEQISRAEEAGRFEREFSLPAALGEDKLSYTLNDGPPPFFTLAGLGVLGAVVMSVKEKNDLQKREKNRRSQMLLDYSEVLSRLIIFLGAGMSIRSAWERICGEYRRAVERGDRTERYIYEEMYLTGSQIKSGISEAQAFREFGNRCGLQQYMKLAALLEQNRKNGSRNLRERLRLEMAEAFEERKHQARRLGEEAGTKLLVPLFLLLAVVMVMIAVPAWLAFG